MSSRLFTYIGSIAVLLLLIGLGGWYLFLRYQTGGVSAGDAERGIGESVPSFFGSRGSTIANIAETLGFGDAEDGDVRPPRLWRVNATPVAGAEFLSGSSTLRFVERSTGHVFDVSPATGAVTRRTNTLVPQVYEAYISAGGVVARSVDDAHITTFAATISTTTKDGFSQLIGSSLPDDILSLSVHPALDDIAYLIRNSAGAALLIRSNLDGTEPSQIASLLVGGWNMLRLRDGSVILLEKPASGVPGSAFRVTGGALMPLIRNIPGLTALPHPSSGALIYGSDTGTSLQLFAVAANAAPTALSIRTVADKCVWGAGTSTVAYCAAPRTTGENFINSWLRGITHTSDAWWTVDPGSGGTKELFTPEESEMIDVESPRVDDSDTYLAFLNRYDKSLWILRIPE